MNPQIEKQISELLELVKNGAEQLPPYLQTLAHQAVTSKFITCSLAAAFSTVVLAGALALAKKSRTVYRIARDEKHPDYNKTGNDEFFPWAIFAAALSIVGTMVLCCYLPDLIRCFYCPDLVAFQELTKLLH